MVDAEVEEFPSDYMKLSFFVDLLWRPDSGVSYTSPACLRLILPCLNEVMRIALDVVRVDQPIPVRPINMLKGQKWAYIAVALFDLFAMICRFLRCFLYPEQRTMWSGVGL